MPSYVAPAGWPGPVRPPGAPEWERTAQAWLLDQCPPEYRTHTVLRRHLVLLARLAVLHVEASQAALARGLGEIRPSLREQVAPHTVEEAVVLLERETARLVGLRRAVGLVEEAVRGRRFVARL
ncbi:hypothetical protein GCM10011519_02970 [Marmoricola endophyticus]|uniref:Uncharacterized protein n=1 Tax=Marmoricola endophyticus TaxID=2040280 RepID=A0A917BAK9_9ACTN|nr:hypothetical protein [Marmoricola endophyticus]GGF32927.1 hypothetical protein GCM10011519_02970 [Marmoricola endophyticus]